MHVVAPAGPAPPPASLPPPPPLCLINQSLSLSAPFRALKIFLSETYWSSDDGHDLAELKRGRQRWRRRAPAISACLENMAAVYVQGPS